MNRTDVQGTLQEMWVTRPARPRQDRQVAGVATAIGRRYDIDPVLVRVGFVVAGFTGIGALLYVAGWAALPEEPDDPADPVPVRSPRGILLVALVVATLGGLAAVFGGDGRALLPTLAVVVLLFLLHRSRGDRVTARRFDIPVGSPDWSSTAAPSPAGPSLVEGERTPPAWDPLGAAPFAWDLPEPGPGQLPPAPRRLPVTAVTLGIALLAGGVTAVLLLLTGSLTIANIPLLLGVVLAVLGSGLVVGAFLRAGRGLIPIALIVSALTWGAVAAPLDRWQGNGFGELRAAPATVAQLLPRYERTAGDVELDLRNLDLTVPTGGNTSPVRTAVVIGAGDVQVRIPRDADLTLTTSIGVGEVSFGSRVETGTNPEIDVMNDLGADGVASGRLLVLDIEAGAADVEVLRG